MAKKEHVSETPATQLLRKKGAAFTEHPYAYEEHGGTAVSARELGVEEHALLVRSHAMDIISKRHKTVLLVKSTNVYRKGIF